MIGADIGALMLLLNAGGSLAKIAVFFRAFRIMRIFRLVRSYGQVIISTLIIVLFQIINILSLIFLLIFIYSALGINLFATVMYREAYNSQMNFRSFPNAIMLLMQVASGENWAQIMYELAKDEPYEGVE